MSSRVACVAATTARISLNTMVSLTIGSPLEGSGMMGRSRSEDVLVILFLSSGRAP